MSSKRFRARIVDVRSGDVVAGRVVVARSACDRLRGLLFRPNLGLDEAVWLEPCNGIHTCGLKYPVGVVVLDAARSVVAVVPSLPPRRVLFPVRRGRITVEMLPGTLERSGVAVGDALRLEPL